MKVQHLDHLVLTVKDINKTLVFYRDLLGMEEIRFGDNRVALGFNNQKINLHPAGNEFEPKAGYPQPGSADLCFITDTELSHAISEINKAGIEIEQGPVERTGACGTLLSFYIRDPDENLVEISNLIHSSDK